jgi:hypothetical protein
MHEPVRVPTLPPDLVAGADISWARLITGIVLLVLSLVMGYRSAHHPPPPKAEPHPVRNQLVVSADLPPLEPAVVGGVRTIPDISAVAPFVPAARAEPVREVAPRVEHVSHHRSLQHARLHRHRDSRLVARTRFTRTRAAVRREYFRDRAFVAAFGGEDSGSVYLSRVAAEQRATRSDSVRHRFVRPGAARG